jgi:3-hydroxybutyryl-CoA dehydrogenase
MEIKKVGVIGCGVMGSGIAQTCAQAKYQVIVLEISDELLDKGLSAIKAAFSTSVKNGRLAPQEVDALLERISGTTKAKDLSDCDLIIEASTEDMDVKKRIFAEMDRVCHERAILATNTSCLSVLDMAMVTSRPGQVIGLHFFNPVPVIKLLEVVRTIATSEETLQTSRFFGESLGKTVVIAQDTPGFIVNRLLLPFLLQAISLLETGYASRDDIDTAVNLGLGHPMGPLRLADLIGLDIVEQVSEAIYDEVRDPRYIPPILLKRLVATGCLGRKTGVGFYEYRSQ